MFLYHIKEWLKHPSPISVFQIKKKKKKPKNFKISSTFKLYILYIQVISQSFSVISLRMNTKHFLKKGWGKPPHLLLNTIHSVLIQPLTFPHRPSLAISDKWSEHDFSSSFNLSATFDTLDLPRFPRHHSFPVPFCLSWVLYSYLLEPFSQYFP